MPRTTDGPQWAQELVAEITTELVPDVATPRLTWNSRRKGTPYNMFCTGRAGSYQWPGSRIHVTAGTWDTDVRMCLLHEIAHWTLPVEAKHDSSWAARAFDLYKEYGSLEHALHWERSRQVTFHALTRKEMPSRFLADGTLGEKCFGCPSHHRSHEIEVTSKTWRKRILQSLIDGQMLGGQERYAVYVRRFKIQDEWLERTVKDPALMFHPEGAKQYQNFFNQREQALADHDFTRREQNVRAFVEAAMASEKDARIR